MAHYYGWKPYVPVAARRHRAQKELAQMRKKGLDVQPVEIEGRKIARTFWGQAWCDHMEALGDFANRLPRGRTYVRNGSVCHLAVQRGQITALVSGSELYHVAVEIGTLSKAKWGRVKQQCSGRIGSLLELVEGRISESVMEVVTDRDSGLFPLPREIDFSCDCPDYATMCKHIAAVLYGVGARLDRQPESLFVLRGVDHAELITASADAAVAVATTRGGGRRRVAATDLSDIFGIDLEDSPSAETSETAATKKPQRKSAKAKSAKAKSAKAKSAKVKSAKATSPGGRARKSAKSTHSETKAESPSAKAKKKTAKKKTSKKTTAKKGPSDSSQKSVASASKRAAKKKTSTRKTGKKVKVKASRASARSKPR